MMVIMVLLVVSATLLLTREALRFQEAEEGKKREQEYLASVEELCASLQEKMELSRRYHHDLSKHIRVLETMLAGAKMKGEIQPEDGMRPKEDLLAKDGSQPEENFPAENQTPPGEMKLAESVVQAVLDTKKEQCAELGIPFQVHLEQLNDGGVRDIDLVALLQNLLDNAIEEQERICQEDQRGICLSMGMEASVVRIEICNQILPGEKVDFRTKKATTSEHGFGMKIIESIIEKYNGRREISIDKEKHLLIMRMELLAR